MSGETVAFSAIYIHATALVVGEAGVLVRGVSGAGKSRLALWLIDEARRRRAFARLVGDDRVALTSTGGRLIARGHPAVAGQIERRGYGIVNAAHEPACVLRVVIDLVTGTLPRWPAEGGDETTVAGIVLARLVLPAGLAQLDVAYVFEQVRDRAHL